MGRNEPMMCGMDHMINLENIINYLQLLVLLKAVDLEILLYGGLYIFSCNKILLNFNIGYSRSY